MEIELPPERASDFLTPMVLLIHALLLVVACIYLATGSIVWWLKQEHEGA